MKLPKTHEDVVHLFETTALFDAYKHDIYDVGDIVRDSVGPTLRWITIFSVFRDRRETGTIRWKRIFEIREDDDRKTWRVKPPCKDIYSIPKPAEVAA